MRPPNARDCGGEVRCMRCSCSYKCGHLPEGYSWVSHRTWLNHQSLSAIGKVHSCIRRTLHGQGSSVQNAGTSREGDEECGLCTCHICKGRKWRSRATVAKHLRSQLLRTGLSGPASYVEGNTSSEGNVTVENEDRMFGTHERIPVSMDNARDNGDNIENTQNSNAACVDANEEAVACETHGEAYVQTRILDNERSPTVDEALLTRTIELQSIFDKSHMSMALQSEILELLFGSFGKRVENDEGCLDVEKLSLGELLTLKGKDWNGDLGGMSIPTSWKQLMSMYQTLGMPMSQRWRLCVGPDNCQHEPQVMPSHEEAILDLNWSVVVRQNLVQHTEDTALGADKNVAYATDLENMQFLLNIWR